MRFRYELEDGKHLVKTREDDGTWMEARAYASEEEARAIVAKGEAMGADTIADVEKALSGPKGTAQSGVAPKPEPKRDVSTKAGFEAERKEADTKGTATTKPTAHAKRGYKPRK